jgi:hypothetical protein
MQDKGIELSSTVFKVQRYLAVYYERARLWMHAK